MESALNAFIMSSQVPLEEVTFWPTASEEQWLASNHMVELRGGFPRLSGASDVFSPDQPAWLKSDKRL